jgi:hypothetical protein
MHPVAIYHLRYNHVQNEHSPSYVGLGRLSWERAAKKANRVATTPNATTLYGVGFYDLSKEPTVITVGDVRDRYWSIQLVEQFNAPGSEGFQFAARFYGPHGPLIDGSYNMPGLVRVD